LFNGSTFLDRSAEIETLHKSLVEKESPVRSNGPKPWFGFIRDLNLSHHHEMERAGKLSCDGSCHCNTAIGYSEDDRLRLPRLDKFFCELPSSILPVLVLWAFPVVFHDEHLIRPDYNWVSIHG